MNWDNIGLLLRTNHVTVTPDEVTKTYRPLSIPLAWAYLERKRLTSAKTRYRREKELIPRLHAAGLNVPELTSADDETRTLRWRALELTDLVHVFSNPEVHFDDKLQYLKEAAALLHGIHNAGETHGDPFFKNFFLLGKQYADRQGTVYTCDFEHERDTPHPMLTDILILAANAMSLLRKHYPGQERAATELIEQLYGRGLRFPFDTRDRIYYRARFGMDAGFFSYFSPNGA